MDDNARCHVSGITRTAKKNDAVMNSLTICNPDRKPYSVIKTEFLKRPKILVFAILSVFILLTLKYLTWNNDRYKMGALLDVGPEFFLYSRVQRTPFRGEKIVHLDLKGAPFKVTYYKNLFELLSKLGATGVLIEYEDMFPYWGLWLKGVPAYNAYSPADIGVIVANAKKYNLTVIPLIQTFGHLEHILKLKDFIPFREVPSYPQVLCPTHENTLNLIMEMVQQIVHLHPGIDKLHIGSDEVWYLGVCPRCKLFLQEKNITPQQLFLHHVTRVATEIRNRYPKLRILMWDDHFRSMTYEDLNKTQIGKIIEPVVWKYTTNVFEDINFNVWELYANVFPRIWLGSAFKGATGSKKYLPNVTHHFLNHRSWLSIVDQYQDRINFEGFLLTGWQRYDHFAVLCELFPVAIPTLGMCLRLLLGFPESFLLPSVELTKVLECEQGEDLYNPAYSLPTCSYNGGDVLRVVQKFHLLKESFESMLQNSKVEGWVDGYNIRNNFSNPYYVESGLEDLLGIKNELAQLQINFRESMEPIFDNYTINEWEDTYLTPLIFQANKLYKFKENLLSRDDWPRRPLNVDL
ncbi:hypothetical protein FQA39_LY01136 [Lamprigera yunnana]|nr:hypothetical protein FQA39_LY01136 [Lamprigera yunnana]